MKKNESDNNLGNNDSSILILGMITKTWNKEIHGLFNYESRSCEKTKLFFDENSDVIRTKSKVSKIKKFIEEKNNNYTNFNDSELLFSVKKENDYYIIYKELNFNQKPSIKNIDSITKNLWYVINSDNERKYYKSSSKYNEDYFLNKNDIIKLGRIKFILREYHIDESDNSNFFENKENNYNLWFLNKTYIVFNMEFNAETLENNNLNNKILCNICYSEENKENNPLVSLCSCDGGMKYTHVNCIKLWIKTKLIIKENQRKNVKNYIFNNFNCKICKTPFPFSFKIKNKIFNMFDIDIPQNENYIILESLDQIKDNNNYKSIHVITLNDENYIIGRGHDCDIRLNDISVSRVHSLIHFDMIRKLLLIRDLKSKFGTLILIKKPINILNKYLRIQIGRTYIETKLVKEEEVKEYFKENEKGLILFGNISNDNLTTDSDSNISYIFS